MTQQDYVVFAIDGQWCAVPLASVRRIVRAAAVTPVPDGPAGLLGVLDLHGDLVPVFDLRDALGCAPKALRASDRFLIVQNGAGLQGIRADDVYRIGALNLERNGACESLFHRQAGPFCQVAKCDEKTVFVVNTDFLGHPRWGQPQSVKNNGKPVTGMTPRAAARPLCPEEAVFSAPWDEVLTACDG